MKESKEKIGVGWQKGSHFPGEVCVVLKECIYKGTQSNIRLYKLFAVWSDSDCSRLQNFLVRIIPVCKSWNPRKIYRKLKPETFLVSNTELFKECSPNEYNINQELFKNIMYLLTFMAM